MRAKTGDPSLALRPAVALLGRPNVGKSTLFNALAGRQVAITDAAAGTTRDRLLFPVTYQGRGFDLVDTGGIGGAEVPDLSARIEAQIEAALATATILVLVGDVKGGVADSDREIAARLRRRGRPLIACVNKVDGPQDEPGVAEFAVLGLGEPVAVSAIHRRGIADLLDRICRYLPPAEENPPQEAEEVPKLALVGRRNVGKSSFVNVLARTERVIVSDRPGTTRDSIDVHFEKGGEKFIAIDTAGLRRKKRPESAAEFFGQVRTERAIARADVILFLLDATAEPAQLEKRTAALIAETYKPCLLVVNKWDLVKNVRPGDYSRHLAAQAPQLAEAPVSFTSALQGRGVWETVALASELWARSRTRVTTAALNRAVAAAYQGHEPPAAKGHKPRFFYATQVGVQPPSFVVFCARPERLDAQYRRYFERRLAAELNLRQVPVRVLFRPRERRPRGSPRAAHPQNG